MDYKRGAQYILTGLIVFLSLLLVCILIRPVGLVVNSGVSYYGNHPETWVLYTLAFLINSSLLWRASQVIGDKNKIDKYIKIALKAVAILMIGILLTPYNAFNMTSLNLVHRTIGTTLFSIQMIMIIAIAVSVYRDWFNILLLITATLSGYAAIIYLLQPTGYMIEAQIIFQISIWLSFVRYLKHTDIQLSKKLHKQYKAIARV